MSFNRPPVDNPHAVLVSLWQVRERRCFTFNGCCRLGSWTVRHRATVDGGMFEPGGFQVGGEESGELVEGTIGGGGIVGGCLRGGGCLSPR